MLEWTDGNIRDFWEYEANFPENYFAYQVGEVVIDKIKHYFPQDGIILDYGCGGGYLIAPLLARDYRVIATDFSRESVDKVNELYQGLINYLGAYYINDLLAKGQKYEVIIALEVLEHLNDFYLEDMLRNIKLLLSANGIAIFTTPNNENLEKSFVCCPECKKIFHRWQHIRSWNTETLQKCMERNGLEVMSIFTTKFSNEAKWKRFLKKAKSILGKAIGKNNESSKPHLVCIVRKL